MEGFIYKIKNFKKLKKYIYHRFGVYLAGAVDVAGAVVLVDDDGVLDVAHGDVGEPYAGDAAGEGLPPRLDPESVLRAGERRRLHRHVPDLPLAGAPAEAADADPVPGAAPDFADSHARGARPHGDAVVAGAHRRAEDGDVAGQRDVDAVGVGAVRRRRYPQALQRHAGAVEDGDVHVLAVHQRHPLHGHVVRLADVQRLNAKFDQITSKFKAETYYRF